MNPINYSIFFTSELICHYHCKSICVSNHSVSNKGTSISDVGEQALEEANELVKSKS